mmetsp:Transcript_70891/g.200085  ORF Transcript_70891/g.200085 Transcript_70891/m.200085 type:complete len:213 (+) Transcript_70891:161-799(+)
MPTCASALSGSEAIEILLRRLERVHRRRGRDCAVRFPFFVFFLAIWPPGLAHPVGGDAPPDDLVDAVHVHAPLCEQVLPPWLVARDLLVAHVVQRRFAVVNVREVRGNGLVAHDLETPEEAVVDVLAVLQVDAVRRHRLLAQPLAEPRGQEHGVRVDLHGPVLARPDVLFSDLLPHRYEDVCVDPRPGLLPLLVVEVIVLVLDLHGKHLPGA